MPAASTAGAQSSDGDTYIFICMHYGKRVLYNAYYWQTEYEYTGVILHCHILRRAVHHDEWNTIRVKSTAGSVE